MKKLISTFYFLLFTFYFSTPVHAVICNPILKNCTSSTAPKTYFNSVLSTVFSIFFIVGIIYYVWHIVFAGYHLIASEGDPKRWESGKNEMTYATIGLFVVFSIFAILKFVGIVLGIPGLSTLTITWPTL
ncbi:hypothetical protein HYV64_03940 [Candidatus Shapirobacteria bacterium]|nr:hypothetical protein [Candidatus Shapirobacteria bacterium]